MDAVILAGGQGTRLRPLTDTRPKPLLPFCGAPFAAGLLRRLSDAGVVTATFLVGADPAPFLPLEALGDQLGVRVTVVPEPQPLDTAGACRDLLRDADKPVLVCNGDILTDLDYAGLVTVHRDTQAVATLALTRVTDTSSFGVISTAAGGRITAFVEKPPPGTVAADTINAGTYVLSPRAFDGFAPVGPLSFERAVFPTLLERGALLVGVATDDFWLDLGTPDRYLSGTAAVMSGSCRWPLDPAYTRPAQGVLAHPSAVLQGSLEPGVVIGPGVKVGDGARIAGSVLFEGVTVGEGATVEDSILAEHTTVDPHARCDRRVTAAGQHVSAESGGDRA